MYVQDWQPNDLIVYDNRCDITVDGNLPQDIRDQFGFVKHAEATRININTARRKPLWVIEGNRQKSDEPLITAAYVLSALMDAHGYKIVGIAQLRLPIPP